MENNLQLNNEGRKKYICILDTETTMYGQHVFDIGIIIADVYGNILLEKQWLIAETFFTKLFYEEKRELYLSRLESPAYPTVLVTLGEALKEMENIFKFFRIKEIYAYNMSFDSRVIKKLALAYDLPNPFDNRTLECLWFWSTQSILQKASFREFADLHNLKTEKGNYKTSAEITYAYLIQDPHFIEEHTALEDCKIELEIYKACKKTHGVRARGIASNPWLLPQPDEQIEKLPPQFRTMKIQLHASVDQAVKLLEKLNKKIDVEVDIRIGEEEI